MYSNSQVDAMVASFNASRSGPRQSLSIYELFAAAASRLPHQTAVRGSGREYTYQALQREVAKLAWHLRSLGVDRETPVGVAMKRTPDLVVALLAVLKAGGCYVPLDPVYPANRLKHMIDRAGIPLLLTESDLVEQLPPCDAHTLLLDQILPTLAQGPEQELEVLPQHPAYIIFTSGSTGQPKGIQVTHGSVANFLQAMASSPGLAASDTLLAVTTVCFDISVLELFLPLSQGACLVVAAEEDAGNPHRLMQLIEDEGVTIMQATPVTWAWWCPGA